MTGATTPGAYAEFKCMPADGALVTMATISFPGMPATTTCSEMKATTSSLATVGRMISATAVLVTIDK